MSFAGNQAFVRKQLEAATATLRPWASARGGAHSRTIGKEDERSRPSGINTCRGWLDSKALLAPVLLTGAYGTKKRLQGVAVAVTQLLNSKQLWDWCMSKDYLARDIRRLLSLGPDQQTTLVDQIIARHRLVKIMGKGRDALSNLGEVLHQLGLFAYTNTDDAHRESETYYTIVDGPVIKEIRDICVALSSEYSDLTGFVNIEMALLVFFQMAVGDEKLAKLLAYVFAHCLFGAVGMVVARECCKEYLDTLAAVAFNEGFVTAREDLVLALGEDDEVAVASAVASFKAVWASLEGQARGAYDDEKAARILNQMQFKDLYQDRDEQTDWMKALKKAKGAVTLFMDVKGCVSVGGKKPQSVGVVRVDLTAASLTTDLKDIYRSKNTTALKSNAVALLVAAANLGTTGSLHKPIQPYLKGYGPRCQMVSYADTFYRLRASALLASIQGDVWLYFHAEDRWYHSSRPGEAAIEYSLLKRAVDAGYSRVEEYLRDGRNSTDVATLRCVSQYRTGADKWDAYYVKPKDALLEDHLATMAQRAALTDAGMENGGKLAGVTVVLLGTKSYNSAGKLRGSGGQFGASVVAWAGAALWLTTAGTSTDGFAEALARAGAEIVDASLVTGDDEVEVALGKSRRVDQLKGGVVAVVPNDWEAGLGRQGHRYGQFQSGAALYREQVFKCFFESGGKDFFS